MIHSLTWFGSSSKRYQYRGTASSKIILPSAFRRHTKHLIRRMIFMQASCPKKSPHDKALCLAGGALSGVLRRCTAAAMLLLTAFPISAFAAEHLSLWPLRGHLYVVEDEFYTKENSMVYVGEKSVTVIGATWTPDTAKQLVIKIRKISDAPITQVINTNYHTDRAGGNAYFKAIGAEIVATEMTREQMARGWDEIIQFTRSGFPNYPENSCGQLFLCDWPDLKEILRCKISVIDRDCCDRNCCRGLGSSSSSPRLQSR